MRPGLPKLKKDSHPLNDYIDLTKVKSFNETLFSDLFKRDDIQGKLQFGDNPSKSYLIVPLKMVKSSNDSVCYTIDRETIEQGSMRPEQRLKKVKTLRDFLTSLGSEKVSDRLFVSRSNLNSVCECTKVIEPTQSTLEQLLTDLQLKYRDNLDGVSIQAYLYSTASKLAVVKNFREEAFNLHTDFSS